MRGMMCAWRCALTARRPSSAAPGPLDDYAREFDDLFGELVRLYALRVWVEQSYNTTWSTLPGSPAGAAPREAGWHRQAGVTARTENGDGQLGEHHAARRG